MEKAPKDWVFDRRLRTKAESERNSFRLAKKVLGRRLITSFNGLALA